MERGIIFQGWGVRAIRNMKPGVWPAEAIDPSKPIKWQTRRVIKPQPDHAHVFADGVLRPQSGRKEIRCPYGIPGDGLWVRETWGIIHKDQEPRIIYRADEVGALLGAVFGEEFIWKPSIHLHRRNSREDLVVKEVRVERVQEISDEDAWAEGFYGNCSKDSCPNCAPPFEGDCEELPIQWFAELWDEINKARGFGWEANPGVWVVSYMRKAK